MTPSLFAQEPGQLQFKLGENIEFAFDLRRRVTARGRVIDAEAGEPIVGDSVWGEVVIPSDVKPSNAVQMTSTGTAKTNSQGEFTLPVAVGSGRVEYIGDSRISEQEYTYFTAAADGSTVIPDIKVRRLPKFTGSVRNPDGTPAARVVVRIRGNRPRAQYLADPVLTDEHGQFEIQPHFWLEKKVGLPDFEPLIVAFDPYRRRSGKSKVSLANGHVEVITLEPHDLEWTLTEFWSEQPAWSRGVVAPDQAAEAAAISLLGKPCPEIDATAWINSHRLTSADLRGKYVLLNFWFINCGACHEDFPSLKLIHELYKDRGLVVIGIHNNSNAPDAVEKHVAQQGLPFPVAVDQPDGTTVAGFLKHGIAQFFPSYVLIGPDGKVLLDDKTIPAPLLRGYKIEIIRNLLGTAGKLEASD